MSADPTEVETRPLTEAETLNLHGARLAELTQSLARIEELLQGRPPAQPVQAGNPIAPPVLRPPARSYLKPAVPATFNGDRAKGRAFLNTCKTYIKLLPEQFPSHEVMIIWITSFMFEGRAELFATRVQSVTPFPFDDFAEFEREFVDLFCELNEDVLARTRLEGTAYHQGRRSIDEFIDEFRDLIHRANYQDPYVIVMKYRRGLSERLQNQIAEMGADRPNDRDIDGWVRMARRIDQNRLANDAFRAPVVVNAHRPVVRLPVSAPRAPFRVELPQPQAPRAALPAPAVPANRPLPPGIPMDIDANRVRRRIPGACYRCGQPGHIAANCPNRHDVRYFSSEELEIYAAAKRDAKEATVRAIAQGRDGLDTEEDVLEQDQAEEGEEQDFARNVG